MPFQLLSYDKELKMEAPMRKLITMPMLDSFKVALKLNMPACGYTVITYDNLVAKPLAERAYKNEEEVYPRKGIYK